MSTPANFNGARPVIDVNDTAMLLIDHQSGLFQTVGDMPMPELRARAAALAKMASLAGIPVITTASVPQGPNGPLIPEIHENAPHAKYIARKGEINAWDNPEFVAAVKATGRKTLIIAGTITSVCMAFPAIAAVADGYKVFAVIDASGTYSKMAQEITLARVVQAGVVPMDTAAVASELQRTWNRPDAAEWAEVYTKVFPAYQLLIESYSKAQDVVKNNEHDQGSMPVIGVHDIRFPLQAFQQLKCRGGEKHILAPIRGRIRAVDRAIGDGFPANQVKWHAVHLTLKDLSGARAGF